jgi:predicted kinase
VTAVAVVLMGLPGSGKSSLLREIRRQLPWAVVDRDAIRAAMFPQPVDGRAEKDAANDAVWAALAAYLRFGVSVFVDGMTFASQANRDRAAALAAAAGAGYREIWLDVPVAVCQARVAAQTDHPSPERSPALVAEVAARFAPVAAAALRLDGREPLATLAAQAVAALQAG